MDPLYYEVVHNLVVEITRLGIEVQNLKMRVESLSSRLDFDERRARSLETVVQYRKPAPQPQRPPQQPRPSTERAANRGLPLLRPADREHPRRPHRAGSRARPAFRVNLVSVIAVAAGGAAAGRTMSDRMGAPGGAPDQATTGADSGDYG